ncbi:hypothetical protein BDA96_07G234200 [Sorghum bicolor]|uniref:Uncharacterized protein n=1 Tax=Sorghum bicolor TaxID=4558 RepID=A0A921QMY0_SORBI|nr:hypothetical protein BDA96_07G234200 [Sorghum bicolor]
MCRPAVALLAGPGAPPTNSKDCHGAVARHHASPSGSQTSIKKVVPRLICSRLNFWHVCKLLWLKYNLSWGWSPYTETDCKS